MRIKFTGFTGYAGNIDATQRKRFYRDGAIVEGLKMDEIDIDSQSSGEVQSSGSERKFSQEAVNAILKNKKAEIEQRLREEYEAKYAKAPADMPAAIDPSSIAQEVWTKIQLQQEEALKEQKRQQEAEEVQRFQHSFVKKLSAGKDDYEDFDAVVNKFNGQAYPVVAYVAHDLPNTSDVMYHLGKNKSDCARLQTMANLGDFDGVVDEMTNLSKSLESNKQAKKVQAFNNYQPTPRLKPSGAGSGQKVPTATELDDISWLRG